ncbi:hypothetical protein [Pseudorhodobacter ferrugineus]|uniref:hypothetical protein n=1 Tax=Pseudorhodobacter ferrugineus TaxID=77008 RepID=UPI0003B34879|nr:hypothetical protein [Pseudorhodobacter ferrugineus]
MRIKSTAAVTFLALSLPLFAQTAPPSDFTTPQGAAYIHQQIKDQIVSFTENGDQDLIYFTAILAWRCGVQEIYYGLNDAPIVTALPLEPCNRDLRQPNQSKFRDQTYPMYITVPKGSAQSVSLRVIYEDGTVAEFVAERATNLVF